MEIKPQLRDVFQQATNPDVEIFHQLFLEKDKGYLKEQFESLQHFEMPDDPGSGMSFESVKSSVCDTILARLMVLGETEFVVQKLGLVEDFADHFLTPVFRAAEFCPLPVYEQMAALYPRMAWEQKMAFITGTLRNLQGPQINFLEQNTADLMAGALSGVVDESDWREAQNNPLPELTNLQLLIKAHLGVLINQDVLSKTAFGPSH